jgi:hypothetical protein
VSRAPTSAMACFKSSVVKKLIGYAWQGSRELRLEDA